MNRTSYLYQSGLYYGNFHALKNINLELRKRVRHSSGLPAAANPLCSDLNRMNDLIEGCRILGAECGLLDGEDIYKGMDVNLLAAQRSAWCSRSRTRFR